ncbi:MAG: response regulator [Chitinophagaceae bacterium]|nr:response regulator [Anaerolineae bacterium]
MAEINEALVLVVDDNEMNRDMLSRRLERQGYRVLVAENGIRALEMMEAHNFDLVLLDIMMPKMNGYEVLERVKADDHLRHIPVIMISAVDDLDSVVKCIELGAEDYLFKPFNPVLLKARVGASLEKKRGRDLLNGALMGQLRAPISAILQKLEDLLEDSGLSPTQAEALKQIQIEANTLKELL